MSGVLYLGPHEIDLVHFGLVALHPPEPILEERSDNDRVISFTYGILINYSAAILLHRRPHLLSKRLSSCCSLISLV